MKSIALNAPGPNLTDHAVPVSCIRSSTGRRDAHASGGQTFGWRGAGTWPRATRDPHCCSRGHQLVVLGSLGCRVEGSRRSRCWRVGRRRLWAAA